MEANRINSESTDGAPSPSMGTKRAGRSSANLRDLSRHTLFGTLLVILALTGCVGDPHQLVEGQAPPEQSAEPIASTSTLPTVDPDTTTPTEPDTTPTTEPDTTPTTEPDSTPTTEPDSTPDTHESNAGVPTSLPPDAQPPGAALAECPVPPSGEWAGTWQSDRIEINGTATAMVQIDRTGLSGSLDLQGPADVYLVDSGPITGTVNCLDMALSVADDTLVLNGSLTSDGRSFTGTYDATLNGGDITDFGTFRFELNP